MSTLPHHLTRTVVISAPREMVFGYFTDSARWASWWGAGSTIDPQVGGRVYIRYPGNVEVSGHVISVSAPEQIVFTYGFESGTPFGPGQSRVEIALTSTGNGTRLTLSHAFAEESARDEHVQGWRYQLAVFSNLVTDALHASAADTVDAWFDAWAEPDAEARARTLDRIAATDITFRDRYSMLDGLPDLLPHIAASQRFMPGIRLTRQGVTRHCQGTVLADWTATSSDGRTVMTGVNVFALGGDGKIQAATGFATPNPT